MSSDDARQLEIRDILVAANAGAATDEQLLRLDCLIRSNPHLANYAARLLEQQAALAWQGDRELLADSSAPPQVVGPRRAQPDRAQPLTMTARFPGGPFAWASITVGAFAMGLLISTVYWANRNQANPPAGGGASAAASRYEARLVGATACLWDQNSSGSLAVGSALTSGESLHLLEGVAEFNLNWSVGGNAALSLEGPAAMMLTSEGMPTLRFGRLTARIEAREHPFVLDTSVGRLVLNDYGSVGVAAFGNDAEIHVFDGAAALEPAWGALGGPEQLPLSIKSGEALRIQVGENGELTTSRHPAERSYFVAQVSMASDTLVVPRAYVNAVKADTPIGYWRMEREAWPRIPNEMGSRFACHVEGSIGRTGRPGNQGLEFGVTDEGGDILCNEALGDSIGDSYSIEVWIKPSHYHLGAVVSLIGDPPTPDGVVPHGMLMELGGSGRMPTAVHHPGRIRFLHRSPATNESQVGTSCYSEDAYQLRRWQHVVAVKDGATMSLYINGELVGASDDSTRLPAGLRMLVGRLYPSRQIRPFKGQLDELALYNRALKLEEIQRHYHLIRPELPPKPAQPST